MKKTILILAAILFLALIPGCSKSPTYLVSEKLMHILWDVNYKTFTADATTKFAKEHYESEFLQDYMGDPSFNAGVEKSVEQELISHIVSIEDKGTQTQDDMLCQQVRVKVFIDHFSTTQQSYFEQGKEFVLIYSVYFIQEQDEYKISYFSFTPENEEFLPVEEKNPLTDAQKDAISFIAKQYLQIRYSNTSSDDAWSFYSANCTQNFLDNDGITQKWLQDFTQNLAKHKAKLNLEIEYIKPYPQKKFVNGEFYYAVETKYTYTVDASEEFLQENNLDKEQTLTEYIYFVQNADTFNIDYAKYDGEEG